MTLEAKSRPEWLRDVARSAELRMDERWAPDYDEQWGTIDPTHAEMLARLLARLPHGASVLDAACGTGKYWPMLLERGVAVAGTDRSSGMLATARRKHPDVPTRHEPMTALADVETYDAVICVDAMENVPPEDWPVVAGELARDDAYHYYPESDQVRSWLATAGFAIEEEAVGDGYYHFIARASRAGKLPGRRPIIGACPTDS